MYQSLDAAQKTRQINLLRSGVGQGAVSQSRHELFQGRIKPAIKGRAGHPWNLRFQIRPQDIGLVGSTRCASRNDHGSDQHPEVQFALPLDHPALRAQSFDFLLGQNCLKHLPHVLTRHVCSLQHAPPALCFLMQRLGE
jgi:hypothetical protein